MFFLPSFHQGSICGNSIDPCKEAGPFLESVDFGPYRYVGVLKDLFGIRRILADAVYMEIQLEMVFSDDGLQRFLVPLLQRSDEAFFSFFHCLRLRASLFVPMGLPFLVLALLSLPIRRRTGNDRIIRPRMRHNRVIMGTEWVFVLPSIFREMAENQLMHL